MKHPVRILIPLLLLLAAGGNAQPLVVTTIHPYFDLTRQIAGDAAEVVRLLPTGASPHTFEPTPRDVARVARADLLVMNGGIGVDEWLSPLIEASENDAPLLQVIESIELEPAEQRSTHDHSHEESAEEHDAATADGSGDHLEADGFVNAHVWLDVTLALQAAEAIEDMLVQVDPGNETAYRANGAILRADLVELDREILATLAPAQGEPFVPFHNAWPYFARRYGLDLILEIEPFPGREPSPAYLVQTLRLIEESDAKALFAERQLATRPAEVVADSASLSLFMLDPIGGSGDLRTYQQMMRYNARTVLEALGQ